MHKIKLKHSYEIMQNDNKLIFGAEYDYQITIRITELCNIKCEYCEVNKGKPYKYDDIIRSITLLNKFFDENNFNKVLFYFHGGEPTTHPKLLDILKYIKTSRENNIIELQTNLLSSESFLKQYLKHIDLLSISYHYMELVRVNKLELFMNNINYIVSNNYYIDKLDIMLENVLYEHIDIFHNTIEHLLKLPNIINSEMIYFYSNYDYNNETSKKHLEFYKKYNKTEQLYKIDGVVYSTNELFGRGLDCVGSRCDAGKTSIIMNGNGDVFKCGQHLMEYFLNNKGKPFINIIENGFKSLNILYKIGTRCVWDYCCGDFYLNKNIKG